MTEKTNLDVYEFPFHTEVGKTSLQFNFKTDLIRFIHTKVKRGNTELTYENVWLSRKEGITRLSEIRDKGLQTCKEDITRIIEIIEKIHKRHFNSEIEEHKPIDATVINSPRKLFEDLILQNFSSHLSIEQAASITASQYALRCVGESFMIFFPLKSGLPNVVIKIKNSNKVAQAHE